MSKIFDLKQDRAKAVAQMREIMNKYGSEEMTAEDKAAYAKAEAEFDSLNSRIDQEEKLMARERAIGEAEDKEQKAPAKNERMEMFAKALSGRSEDMAAYRNQYTLGNDPQAGNLTAPVEFVDQLIKGLDDTLFMRRICHMTPRIGNAQSLGFPYRKTEADDAEWIGEIADAAEEKSLEYARREFKPHRMNKMIKLSRTLVNHAALAPSAVLDEMRYRIAVTQEKAYMTGDGVNKPLGIFTASDNGVPTGRDVATAGASIASDDLFNVKYSLKSQYLRGARWIMHRDVIKEVAKMKDGSDAYIWQPSIQEGQPDRLLGLPVEMSEYAPNTVESGNYLAVLGNFKYYWICDADTLVMQVLRELYAPNNQVGYLFDYFGDGAPVVGEAFARMKLA